MFRVIAIGSNAFKLAMADGASGSLCREIETVLATLPDDDIAAIRDALLLLHNVHGYGVRLDGVGASHHPSHAKRTTKKAAVNTE